MARRYNGFQRGYASTGVNEAVRALQELGSDVEAAAKEALKNGADQMGTRRLRRYREEMVI